MIKLTTIRDTAYAMRPEARADYLMGIIEDLHPVMCGSDHATDAWGLKMLPAERMLLCTLYDAAPRCLSHYHLHGIVCAKLNSTERTQVKLIHVCVSRLRKRLPAAFGRVVTHWGRGYSFERTAL